MLWNHYYFVSAMHAMGVFILKEEWLKKVCLKRSK